VLVTDRQSPRLLVWPLALGALSLIVVLLGGAHQATAQPQPCYGDTEGSQLSYGACEEDPGQDGTSGGSGGSSGGGGEEEPTCDLSQIESFIAADEKFCEGENVCFINDPPLTMPNPEDWPGEPPTPDSKYIYKYCENPNGNIILEDFFWTNAPEEPSIEEQAREAFGRLEAPGFTLAFSPPEESVIYIETWWWAQGAPSGNLEGSSAFGLVAIAEPDHIEVDPGDGSSTIMCDVVTSESDACTHTYERASGDGGYPARARLVYDVHFEMDGAPIEVEGVPATFESEWQETAVPVTEVQSSVVR
jgi:hypothetical protein